ncbi:MAG: hypothetical protein OER88_06385, partial [Planctomycetota bacterium]|nr:hypothetical protein [Planctomycetota bacterium]
MNTFLHYLWKEWRDHRAVVLGLVLTWPLLLVLAAFTVPQNALREFWFAGLSGAAVLGIFVFAACTDLVPGEARRGTLRFLARMPAGLRPPLLAKLAFFALGCGALTGFGWLGGALVTKWVGGPWPSPGLVPLAAWIVAAIAWAFAVSCCLPRGVLALPATAIALALLFAPVLWAMITFKDLVFSRYVTDLRPWLWAAAGAVAAYCAFVRG